MFCVRSMHLASFLSRRDICTGTHLSTPPPQPRPTTTHTRHRHHLGLTRLFPLLLSSFSTTTYPKNFGSSKLAGGRSLPFFPARQMKPSNSPAHPAVKAYFHLFIIILQPLFSATECTVHVCSSRNDDKVVEGGGGGRGIRKVSDDFNAVGKGRRMEGTEDARSVVLLSPLQGFFFLAFSPYPFSLTTHCLQLCQIRKRREREREREREETFSVFFS